jgi:signal transduction histidine kinase
VASISDVADVLRKAFPGLEGDGFDHLMAVACERVYPAEAVVIREEEVGQTFFIILQGQVEVTKQMDDQTERVLRQHGPGEFFGEMALIETLPRTATVRTLTSSTLLVISKDDFDTVLSQHPEMALTVMRKLTQRLRQADQKAITELRQKNEELARANRELQEQEQFRSEFLTTIAHELRTPLTSASGYLTLIADGRVEGDHAQHACNRSLRNVKRVVKLVNDILFLQEMDLILPEFRPVSLRELIGQVVGGRGQQAFEAGLSLRVQIEENLPQVMGDSEWLHRAIDALLDNAIKFSPNGGEISIGAAYQSGQVQLAISDQGVGMPADQMDRVFERFQRIQQAGPHLFGGVGLGLPLVKQVVEQHGGTIEVHTVEGQGSTFILSLPVANETRAGTFAT